MNSLQQELNNINQQLEHLTFRKNQLKPIIAEYNDTLERVKNLVSTLEDANIATCNLKYDLEDILEGNEAGEWCSETDIFSEDEPAATPTPEPQPEPQLGQDFPTDWMQVTEEAHSSEPTETEQATESEEQPEDYDSFYPELTPEPTPQPVRLMAFVPFIPGLPPELTQEPTPEPTPAPSYCPRCLGTGIINKLIPEPATPDPDYDQWDVTAVSCPECTPKPEPEPLTQINMQAYRRGDDVLVIGFTNKRLMNQWSKWFKSTWSDQVHVSDHSDNLQGFNYCLTVLWFGNPYWERLTKLNYSLKPTEQNRTLGLGQVASSEEE